MMSLIQEVIGSVRAVESIRPNAVIRYEKVSGSDIFTVTSTGVNAGAITLSGTVDAETVQTYTVTIRVSSELDSTLCNKQKL